MPPRLTTYQRKIQTLENRMNAEMTAATLSELQRLRRDLIIKLERLDKQRVKINKTDVLNKQYYSSRDMWHSFMDRLRKRLMKIVLAYLGLWVLMHETQAQRVTGLDVKIDWEQIARDYEADLAARIAQTTSSTQRFIARVITDWYHDPTMTLDDLYKTLKTSFGESKAKGIVSIENSHAHNMIIRAVATSVGAKTYWWKTMQDERVCRDEIIGPDRAKYEGCKALHGRVFPVTMEMPPRASHIGCRCKAILILPGGAVVSIV